MSAAMLVGSGIALADDGSSSDGGPSASSPSDGASSQATKPRPTKRPQRQRPAATANGAASGSDSAAPARSDKPADRPSRIGRHQRTADDAEPPAPVDEPTEPQLAAVPAAATVDETVGPADTTDSPEATEAPATTGKHRAPAVTKVRPAVVGDTGRHRAPERVEAAAPDDETSDEPAAAEDAAPPAEESTPVTAAAALAADTGTTTPASTTTALVAASKATTTALSPLAQTLADVGSFVYNLFAAAATAITGPTRAPAGSNVTVHTSTLQIGGADGVTVSADWYVPTGDEPPTRLIYLQHGFLATAAFYSATAAKLAESTNSIVVAPTVTWNVFDAKGLALMLPTLHKAVADLFVGDRAALNASAQAAGFTGVLPQKVVLVGHSTGGGLVVGTAGYMAENGSINDLAGVVMFDGVGYLDHFSDDLAKIPGWVPVYDVAGTSYSWNDWGEARRELQSGRRGEFTGVQILGGMHSDSMQGTNSFIQFIAYALTGFSMPQNVDAITTLATGWINDMFDGTRTPGMYGSSWSLLTVSDGWWPAAALVLPFDSSAQRNQGSCRTDSPVVSCGDIAAVAASHVPAPEVSSRPAQLV